MAHEIETCMYVGEKPWHGLGTALDSPPTVEAGLEAAGLNWEVGLKSLVTADGQPITHKTTYRLTDGKILGVVGPSWRPLQNRDAFQRFQPLIDSGEVGLHTAGSLKEGRRVWVLGKINKPAIEIAEGDAVERYILLSNGHDGTLATRVGFTPIRVVCSNTLAMAHGDGASKLIKCLHFKGIVQTLEALREVMILANGQFEATAEQYRKLAKCKISPADLRRYVQVVFQVDADKAEGDLPKQTVAKIDKIVALSQVGRGNANPAVVGTLWAAYNGLTEYLGYGYGKTADNRVNSLWFGENANLNRRGLEVALQLAA
jgi:phage/plasmid-like protein (TIGR03299 family)